MNTKSPELVFSYNCEGRKELLKDHIATALSLIDESSKLIEYGYKLDKNILWKIRLAIVFHDVGKALLQNPKFKVNCISFRGHEYISTYVFWRFRKHLLKFQVVNIDEHLLDVAYAILYHHHAMNVTKRFPNLEIYDLKEGLKKLKTVVNTVIRDFLPMKIDEIIIPEDIDENEIKQIVNDIRKEIHRKHLEDSKFRKVSQVILVALLTVDYLSSQKHRKPTRTLFSNVLEEFYNLYMNRKRKRM